MIVRKSAAERQYPGGLDGLTRLEVPNFLEDEHLARISFMSTREAFCLAYELEAAGLRFSDSAESDIAVITWSDATFPPWLSVGECQGHGACWLAGGPPGKLIDIDPSMMLRCPARVFSSVDDVVRVLRHAGSNVREGILNRDGQATVLLECTRDGAQIEIEVFKDAESGRLVGIWGRRNLTRRTSIEADQSMMRDLTAALVSAGAEDPSSRP